MSTRTGPSTHARAASRGLSALAVLAVLASTATAETPPSRWSFDCLRLKNGNTLRGLILEETPTHVRFQNVRRQPGRPTVTLTTVIPRADVQKIDRLSDADRQALKARLRELDPTGQGEQLRMEKIDLRPCPWNGKPKGGLRYDSDHFSLISNAPEEIVRRSAARLEQVYEAYARYLPPRYKGARPTTILLVQSVAEYQKMIDTEGRKFLNLAFYEPATNRILCASDLQRLGEDLGNVKRQHQELWAELDKQAAELKRLYANKKELARYLQPIAETRRLILQADKRNDAVFDRATQQLFAVLYHEAFHAYLSGFVYPPLPRGARPDDAHPGELPRWLNEGLAQIFETALVEAGELRVGHAERERLARAREAVRKGELMPLADLLKAGPKEFIVQHRGDRLGSDRAYLTSWALAHHLMFEKRLLGTPELDRFVRRVNEGGDPVEAFAKLVGQPLPQFEKELHTYLLRLQPDGSLSEAISGK